MIIIVIKTLHLYVKTKENQAVGRQYELTILCDNQANEGYQSEHGFSALICSPDLKILFDTGSGKTLLKNANTAGVSLGQIDYLVLSHGHSDHTGGIPEVLKKNEHLMIAAHPQCLVARYSRHSDKPIASIGMPANVAAELQRYPSLQQKYHTSPLFLDEHIGVTGEIPRIHAWEDTGGPFYLDEHGKYSDNIPDDQAMWLSTWAGLVIILGCCHSGLENTIHYVQTVSGETRVAGIIGGMHMLNGSSARIKKTVEFLKRISPDFIYAGHCTNDQVTSFLKSQLKNVQVDALSAGKKIYFKE